VWVLSGIKIPGYPTDGKIRHHVWSLKPHRRGTSKVDSPKAQVARQSLMARVTNSIPPEPCGEVSGEMSASDDIFCLAWAPMASSKTPDPLAYFLLARETRGTLWQDGEPWGPPNRGTRSRRWDGLDRAPSPGAREPHPDRTWPRSFYHDDVHISTATGVTITIPPNPLSTQIQVPMSPVLNGTEAHRTRHGHSTQHQHMERPKDQRLLYLCAIGKLFPPDKKEDDHVRGHLLVFLFHFHLFTTNVTRALSLEAIKRKVGATSRQGRKQAIKQQRIDRTR
jgi:hypothetical protein